MNAQLHTDGQLTTQLAQWAHYIRDEGNDAKHDEDPYTKAEAKELVELARYVLIYLFTLPGKVAAAKP